MVGTPDGRRVSTGLFSGAGLKFEAVVREAGDLARFADSTNQCFMDASWLMIGC